MNFVNEVSKLLTNKYFLYFIVFLSATNVLGYLVTNKVNAVIFFALVAFLVSKFSKNMVVILLVALVSTNLIMVNRTTREGLENIANSDKKKEPEEVKKELEEVVEEKRDKELEEDEPKPVEKKKAESFGNKKTSKLANAAPVDSDGGSRIDYASTLEGAYDNLDKMLGSDGINKLTSETQKLMQQQQKLFDSMQSMAPMIENAKGMLKGFNPEDLKGLAGIASSLTGGSKPEEIEKK